MPRTRTDLSVARYDLLVVGGGIHGLFAAYDAATRGLSVALVDQDDFGSGLSFNHQRTIHGGLRALEHAQLGKARQQIHERRTWARIAPHMVRPLPFLVGTYRFTKRSRWLVRGLCLRRHRPQPQSGRRARTAPAESPPRVGGRQSGSSRHR
jgi:glycerol-3-phosphate dehydrogenase